MIRVIFKNQALSQLAVMVLLMPAVCAPAAAIEKLEVQGLFANKAVLMVDGVMRVLKEGESSPEGIKLISVSKHDAELSVDGEQKRYSLGSAVSTTFEKKKTRETKISRYSG